MVSTQQKTAAAVNSYGLGAAAAVGVTPAAAAACLPGFAICSRVRPSASSRMQASTIGKPVRPAALPNECCAGLALKYCVRVRVYECVLRSTLAVLRRL